MWHQNHFIRLQNWKVSGRAQESKFPWNCVLQERGSNPFLHVSVLSLVLWLLLRYPATLTAATDSFSSGHSLRDLLHSKEHLSVSLTFLKSQEDLPVSVQFLFFLQCKFHICNIKLKITWALQCCTYLQSTARSLSMCLFETVSWVSECCVLLGL